MRDVKASKQKEQKAGYARRQCTGGVGIESRVEREAPGSLVGHFGAIWRKARLPEFSTMRRVLQQPSSVSACRFWALCAKRGISRRNCESLACTALVNSLPYMTGRETRGKYDRGRLAYVRARHDQFCVSIEPRSARGRRRQSTVEIVLEGQKGGSFTRSFAERRMFRVVVMPCLYIVVAN